MREVRFPDGVIVDASEITAIEVWDKGALFGEVRVMEMRIQITGEGAKLHFSGSDAGAAYLALRDFPHIKRQHHLTKDN